MDTTAWSIEDVRRDTQVLPVISGLLFQLADDDLIMGYRDQEWLGLAPHIEEDVAFGSIGQEEIGHATYYYGMLESLGKGRADDLASLRPVPQRLNGVLVELPNGAGDYLHEPHYDWAWTIVRHYFHDVWEMLQLEDLLESRFAPLSEAARKILGEKRYHRSHQQLWIKTMLQHDDRSQERLRAGLVKAVEWANDLCDFGSAEEQLQEMRIMPEATMLRDRFKTQTAEFFTSFGMKVPSFKAVTLRGRLGEHTPDLGLALETLSEVYRLDPTAEW